MAKLIVIKDNRYFDSVFLMQAARRMEAEPGIRSASALMATEANRNLLESLGFGGTDPGGGLSSTGSNDLIVALEGEAAAIEAVAAQIDAWLSPIHAAGEAGAAAWEPRTVAEAVSAQPDASVAVISVPGEHAGREARQAMREGLHVFLFSSQVPLAEERTLKEEGRTRGLLVMGPDCGTAYLGGAGIGFANAVRRGAIGAVASSGTGLQEFACLVHHGGAGISHGLGTGSHDLSDAIGGISTLAALEALERDPATQVIAVLAKPAGAAVEAKILEALSACSKPVVACFLGRHRPVSMTARGGVRWASTLDEAAALALLEAGPGAPSRNAEIPAAASAQLQGLLPEQRSVRGLFAGGTFCYQAQALFLEAGLTVRSNAPMLGASSLSAGSGPGHVLLDLGAEEFVAGRPHPMIDPTLRRQRLLEAGEDPSVGVILLDFILGAIASKDPAGDLLAAIRSAQDSARRRGGHLCIAASVCGTESDAQGLASQTAALSGAGVVVFPTAARAAAFCRDAAAELQNRKEASHAHDA